MKKNFYFLKKSSIKKLGILALSIMVVSSVFAADITTGLVANYSFDDVNGTTVPDGSGNSNDATLYGAPTVETGHTGSAVNFPTVTDYMQLPNGIVSNLTDFSISTWVYVNTENTWGRIFDFGSDKTASMFLTPKGNSGGVQFSIYNSTAGFDVIGTNPLPIGQWVNMVVTEQGTDVKLYVNGVIVASRNDVTLKPSDLGSTTQNYIAKSQWPDPTLAGMVDEFKIYNRALTSSDVYELAGIPSGLVTEYDNLTATTLKADGDLTTVTSNLNLPQTTSTAGVSIKWTSSNNAVVDTLGNVTQPDKYDATVDLTATFSMTSNGQTYTMTKQFIVTVTAVNQASLLLAQWDFNSADISVLNGQVKVADESPSAFEGTVMNDASIRTIGGPTYGTYNVLYTGNGTGYFDMGKAIGEAVYSLKDYTISCYFRIDSDYTQLGSNGNFIWNFSNSDNAPVDMNGYIIGSLKDQSNACSSSYWKVGNQSTGLGKNAPMGGWHNMAYTQVGNTGTLYIDGVQVAQNTAMTNIPSLAVAKAGLAGTPFNWLGRSCYPSDTYLKKTMLYDFRLLGVGLTSDDLTQGYEGFDPVDQTIAALDSAYNENSNVLDPNLSKESDNLTLTGLDNVTSDLTLPTQGTLDNTIIIGWRSSNDSLISSTGVVHRPKYFSYPVTLTATLIKNGQSVTKSFIANVAPAAGTAFSGDLMVKYDFNKVQDSIVTDEAEKGFKGVLKNQATVQTIGNASTGTYNVLDLGDSIGYFDMGTDMGAIMYNLKNFTIGAYFKIDSTYTELNSNGNFLWSLSNTKDAINNPVGYIIGSLKAQSYAVTATDYHNDYGIGMNSNALQDGWHYMAYTQNDTIGTLYIDGFAVVTNTVAKQPADLLTQPGRLGTWYNWIGRSCYTGDVYLRKTQIYDFRIYDKALTGADFVGGEMDVPTTIGKLDAASGATTEVPQVKASNYYKVITNNHIVELVGLKGTENVSLFDITGRNIASSVGQNTFNVNAGIYFVKVNNAVTKVMVR